MAAELRGGDDIKSEGTKRKRQAFGRSFWTKGRADTQIHADAIGKLNAWTETAKRTI